ncbi:MAG: hypothetical protein WBY44_25415 [Bryobacteraceae bacterium]
MRAATEFDDCNGTYTLIEIAPIVKVPESTLFRWRWQGRLLTTWDFTVDHDMAYRIAQAEILKCELRGPMPVARFNLEDVTRLRVIGYLRELGWDASRTLAALARPYEPDYDTAGDNHTPRDPDNLPQGLVLCAPDAATLQARAFLTLEEAHLWSAAYVPASTILNLHSFRETMRDELAKLDLERERKAARRQQTESEVLV